MAAQSLIEIYAAQKKWKLRPFTIFVEGESDRDLFELASELNRKKNGKRLCSNRMGVCAIGAGDEGGTFGMQEQYPTLRNLSDQSVDEAGKRLFRVVGLLDGDERGKGAARMIVGQHRRLAMWQDMFILHRILPRRTNQPAGIEKHVAEENAQWRRLSTQIEHLVSNDLTEEFFAGNPKFPKNVRKDGDVVHYQFPLDAKAPFVRYVGQNALYEDVVGLAEILRSFRFYFNLPVDGD